ncbi:type IV secretion system protein [Ochrobactrum sp. BTU1]|uniref:type IV secretion system protein n=1 Tax=Ochrobactrum sp. BTU1 TaxID=2840456 RepID=UPI001C04D010|nr:type IV secretion system protein [Ochrobactrum sp. BTU1]
MKAKATVLTTGLILWFSATSAHAFYLVHDSTNIAKAIAQLGVLKENVLVQNELLKNAYEQYKMLTKQFDQLKSIYDQFSGPRNVLGMLLPGELNGLLDGNFSSTSGVLSTLMSGSAGQWTGFASGKSAPMTKTVKRSLEAAGLSSETLSRWTASGEPIQQRTAQQAAGGAMLAATAEQSYKEAGQSLDRVQQILKETQNSPDIKTSIDNNTRMLAELSIQLAKSLEITSTEAVYNGLAGVNAAAERAEERKFFTFGNAQ